MPVALSTKLLVLIVPGVNGVFLTITLYLLDVAFWKSIAVALVSAIVSGVFLLISTVIVTREAKTNRAAIHDIREEQRDVKAKLSADNRRRDRRESDA